MNSGDSEFTMKFNSFLPALAAVTFCTLVSKPAVAVTFDWSFPVDSGGIVSGTISGLQDNQVNASGGYTASVTSTPGGVLLGNAISFPPTTSPNDFITVQNGFVTGASARLGRVDPNNPNGPLLGSLFLGTNPNTCITNCYGPPNTYQPGIYGLDTSSSIFYDFRDTSTGASFVPVSSGGEPIPEPLSIIGTLIGGCAVWRMRKKLNSSNKAEVRS